jgi:deoxyribonuclease-1
MRQLLLALALTLISSLSYADTPPVSFDKAKVLAKESIYHDKHQTFYCGCDFQFTGKSGGRIELESCGYKPRSEGNLNRAERLEWEHVVPASNFGRARQCWQNGGRENCQSTDPVFNVMEADLHNLCPRNRRA